jgi:putative alpha-1,2-mannosidase
MRGKNSDSTWVQPFDPLKISHAGTSRGDYTEANAWQYLWSVQHDIEGLIQLMGGKENFTAKLDSLFFILDPVIIGDGSTHDVSGLIGQYAHGNEPSHHVIYLYNYVNQPHQNSGID